MARLPPDPSTGLLAAVSGVANATPKLLPDGLLLPAPFTPGVAKLGWLRTLKISARNCALRISRKENSFVTETSQFLNPEPRKMLRPAVPNCPVGGAISTEPFLM